MALQKPSTILWYVLLVLGLGAFIALWAYTTAEDTNSNTNTSVSYPEVGDYPVYALADLIVDDISADGLTHGTYNTTGTLIRINDCPPCPKGSVCEVCPPDGYDIGASVDSTETFTIPATPAYDYTIGNTYVFSLKIDDDGRRPSLLGVSATTDTTDETSTTYTSDSGLITVDLPFIKLTGNQWDLTLSGTANVFENAVSISITDENSAVLTETTTLADGDIGSMNPFSATLTFATDSSSISVTVSSSSAKDGSPSDAVVIPLILPDLP